MEMNSNEVMFTVAKQALKIITLEDQVQQLLKRLNEDAGRLSSMEALLTIERAKNDFEKTLKAEILPAVQEPVQEPNYVPQEVGATEAMEAPEANAEEVRKKEDDSPF